MATVADLTAILRLKDELSTPLQSAMKNVTGNIAGMLSFGAAVKVATDALEAQGEQEAAINKLNLALANQGIYTKGASDSLIEYSSSLMEVSTFADEVILSAEAQFVAFGLTEAQTKKATKAALDLAAATGTDLMTAVRSLEKGFMGSGKALKEFGIEVDAHAGKQVNFEQVVSQVESRLGGSALAATQTYAGQMKVLDNQLGEVKESLGKFIGGLLDMEGGTNFAVSMLKRLSDFFSKTLPLGLAEARSIVLEWIANLSDVFGAYATWLGQHPILAKMLGIDAEAAKKAGEFAKDFSKSLREQGEELRLAADKAAAGAGHVQTYANNTHVATGYSKENAEATKLSTKMLEEMNKMLERWDLKLLDVMKDQHKLAEDEMTRISTNTINKMMEERAERIDAAKTAYEGMLHAQEAADAQATAAEKAAVEALNARFDAQVAAIGALGALIGGSFGAAVNQGAGAISHYNQEMDQAKTKEDELRAKIGLAATAVGIFGSLLESKASPALQKFGGALQGAAQGAKAGAAFGPYGAAIGAIGGAIIGFLHKAKQLREELVKIKDSFVQSMGGMDALKEKAQEAGVSLDAIWQAKDKNHLMAAIDEAKKKLDTWGEAQQALTDAAQRYNLTVEEMGPAMQKQELDKQAGQLIQDWKLLSASGVDVNVLIAKMGPNMSDFVNTSIKAGQAIPEAMRPMIDQMIKSGTLLHENGDAFTEAEESGLSFTQTMSEQFQTLISHIDDLVAALGGIGHVQVSPVHVPIVYDDPGRPGGGGEEVPHYARGTNFVPRDQYAFLHRGEAVIPADQNSGGGRSDVASAIAGLSAQLAQQLHPQELARAFRAAGQLS
jgi:hypothetical protein